MREQRKLAKTLRSMGISEKCVKNVVTKPDFLSFNRDFTLNLVLEGQKMMFATGTSTGRVPKQAQNSTIFCLSVCLSGKKKSFRRKTIFATFRKNITEIALHFDENLE